MKKMKLNPFVIGAGLLYLGGSLWELKRKNYALAFVFASYALANFALLFVR